MATHSSSTASVIDARAQKPMMIPLVANISTVQNARSASTVASTVDGLPMLTSATPAIISMMPAHRRAVIASLSSSLPISATTT